jgi:hypothetical protein
MVSLMLRLMGDLRLGKHNTMLAISLTSMCIEKTFAYSLASSSGGDQREAP